ncbi:phage tail protein [Serratia marcescens]|nr:phage tail protein [Serratia marcescens]
MTELESLTAFITANLPERAMQMFQSAMDDCEIIRNAKGLGLGQKRIGVLRYNATLSWDNFPYRECSPGLVYALVLTWLSEHANALNDELKLPDPTVDPEFDDEGSCILQVVVAVADEIILKPSDTGAVPSKGQRWDVVYPEVWTAEEAEYFTQHGSAL